MINPASILTPWANFYVMLGSSASALTGLMFVVISIVSGNDRGRSRDGIAIFSTPTVLHFCSAIIVSAVLLAPWRSLVPVAVAIACAGLAGMFYVIRAIAKTVRLETYRPDSEDWIMYTIMPLIGYIGLTAGAVLLVRRPADATLTVAGSLLALVFIGIRNAWDVVTFLVASDGDVSPTESATNEPNP